MMKTTSRTGRIIAASDACRDNAIDTVIERYGKTIVESWDFNTYLDITTREKIAQAAYFADEHDVTVAEVLLALGIDADDKL